MDPLVPLSYYLTFNLLTNNNQINFGLIPIIIILVLCIAFFGAAETSITCCNRVRIKVKAEDGSKSAKLALKIIERYDKSLITLLIGNNIANLTSSALATILALAIFANNEGLASIISTIVMTLLVFIFGEIIPKNMAKANPDKVLMTVCYPLYFFYLITYPIMMIFNFILWLFKKIFKVNNDEKSLTEDEFQGIIETVEQEGGIDEEESDIIQAAVDFGDITVKDVLTKKEDIVAIDIKKTSRRELLNYLQDIEYSRIPVYEGSIDKIIGIFHVRKFLKFAMKSKNFAIKSAMSDVFTVLDNTKLDDMVELFRNKKSHMAVVKNNKGNMLGIVTMEDVLEELVGESEEKRIAKEGAK